MYICKLCELKKTESRKEIREHIREMHKIKGGKFNRSQMGNQKIQSNISASYYNTNYIKAN